MRDADKLNEIQDRIFADPKLLPKWEDGAEVTYCNLAAREVAEAYGCFDLTPQAGSEPYTADELWAKLHISGQFLAKPIGDCQDLVNAGALIFAVLTGEKLKQHHGHICSLTPGLAQYSGHWDAKAPQAMNIGRDGTCFRRKGVNYAFVPLPEFFAWLPSL